MPVPDLVLPGHPGAEVTPQSPCLSPEQWHSLLDAGIHDLSKVISRYSTDGADFLDGVPKSLLPDLYYLGDFHRSAVYGFFASSKFFLVDAPGGPGLPEFVTAALRGLGREPTAPTAVLFTSCGTSATAGLGALLEKYHVQVVAADEGLERLKQSLPRGTTIVPAGDLAGMGWFKVTTIPLAGRGFAPVAYELAWSGKKVLISGKIPQLITQETGQNLIRDLTSENGEVRGYIESLNTLRDRAPISGCRRPPRMIRMQTYTRMIGFM